MSLDRPKQELVQRAYEFARHGYSADRIIVDPELNRQFVEACAQLGLLAPIVDLNLTLLNMRKRGGFPRSSRRTRVRNQDAYAFAAEIAIRALERRHQTTLDRVLCDPDLAREFDTVAVAVAPGFTSLEYRWAALRLRKTNRLPPEIGRAMQATVVGPLGVAELDTSRIPVQQGIYILASRTRVLYIGEAKNLRARLKTHLEHSDNKLLARYIWESGEEDLLVEYHVLPQDTATSVRRAMELELIRSRRAEFNARR